MPSPRLPGAGVIPQSARHTGVYGPIHVCGTDTRENACWQTALGGGSAHPGSPPCSPRTHTATLNCLFTSSGFPLPLTQQRRHLLSFQRGSERRSEKTQISLEPLKHFEKSLLLARSSFHTYLRTYVCRYIFFFFTFRVFLFYQKKFFFACITNLAFLPAPTHWLAGKLTKHPIRLKA